MSTSLRQLSFAFLLLLGLSSGAAAQHMTDSFPDKEVQIVVPNEPGGGLDLVARLVAKGIAPLLGQSVVVLNRSGASGNVGTSSVARANADGYTLLLTGVGHLVSPLLHSKPGFDPIRDFDPVVKIANAPNVLVVSESLKGLSVRDLLQDPRSRNGGLAFGSAGYGHSSHLAAEVFMARTDTHWLHVPYRGSNPASRALMGGEVQVMFAPAGSVPALVASGKVHAKAVANARRIDALPAVPTLSELGIKDADFFQWYGLFAPAGTPRQAIDVLQKAVEAFMADADTQRQLLLLGLQPGWMNRADFVDFVAVQSQRLSTLVAKEKIQGSVPR
jgi:tripartite-type tricarboxylate transporter receptor subunit TctC